MHTFFAFVLKTARLAFKDQVKTQLIFLKPVCSKSRVGKNRVMYGSMGQNEFCPKYLELEKGGGVSFDRSKLRLLKKRLYSMSSLHTKSFPLPKRKKVTFARKMA